MGNCLDLPPLPPEHQQKGHHHHHHPHHHVNGNSKHMRAYKGKGSERSHHSVRSLSADSIARMSDSYSAYQPYVQEYPPMPPPMPYPHMPAPMLVMDPNTGQTYAYPPPIPVGPYGYPRDIYSEGYYDYYGYGEDGYEKSGKRGRRKKRKENGDLDKNANKKSTLITTFPDPTDDVIIVGNDTMPSRVTVVRDGLRTAGSTRVSTGVQETTTTTIVSGQSDVVTEGEGKTVVAVGVDDIELRQKTTEAPANVQRGSTYITYIKDVPLPPPTEIHVVEEVDIHHQQQQQQLQQQQTTTTTTVTESNVVTEAVASKVETSEDIFVEAPGPVVEVNTLLVDEGVTGEGQTVSQTFTSVSGSRSSRYISTESSPLLLRGTLSNPQLPKADVVVAGTSWDGETVRQIAAQIEGCGISVFASVADPNRSERDATWAGQMIVDAKILVVVLSVGSVTSGQLRDEVSLACVTNTVIFPVAIDLSLDILDTIHIALKLQVAAYKWVELRDPERPRDIVLDLFVNSLREEIDIINSNPDVIDEDFGEVSNRAERRHNMMRRRRMVRMLTGKTSRSAAQFWNEKYPGLSQVDWIRFRQDFMQEHRSQLDSTLPRQGQLHAMEAFRRELVSGEGQNLVLQKAQLVVFCNDDGQDEDLWERFIALARENLAIRDVFDVESSVRIVAIQNIGRYGSPAVLAALRDLLSDQDANIRAVAAVSLSRCIGPSDQVSFQRLLNCLDDSDRLVREAGCLAMGHLKAEAAVPKLTDMWRNDVISHVREAAQAALEEIGGNEAGEAMRVTRILADEIRALS